MYITQLSVQHVLLARLVCRRRGFGLHQLVNQIVNPHDVGISSECIPVVAVVDRQTDDHVNTQTHNATYCASFFLQITYSTSVRSLTSV